MRQLNLAVYLALVLVTMTLVGCLSPDSDDGEAPVETDFDLDWADLALTDHEGHNHADRLDHPGMTTPNFDVVGWDPMVSPYHGTTPGGYACGDVEDTVDDRRLAIAESRTDVGFAITDVTDPFNPQWLGELVMPTTRVYDLAVVPDGKHVVLVMSNTRDVLPDLPISAPHDLQLVPDQDGNDVLAGSEWHHRCNDGPVPLAWDVDEEDPVPRPLSILLVDIQDPSTPTIVDQRPLTGYGHSVDATQIDGNYWVTASNVGSPGQMTWQFFEVVELPSGDHVLDQMSVYNSPLQAEYVGTSIGGHTDGWIKVHPESGDPTAYLVGGQFFITLDMSDPRLPAELGVWTDRTDDRDPPYGNIHSAYALEDTYNGRHYTVLGPEFAGPTDSWVQPTGTIWVVDTTDPADPVEVAAWTLPHDVNWTGTYMFSPHYLTVMDNTIFVSMYHGGVWALDLSVVPPNTENFTQLPSVGVFMPVNESTHPPEENFRWTPNLQEVYSFEDSLHDDLPEGILITFNSNSGVYVFTFDESRPAPSPEPWPVQIVTAR